MPEYGEAEIRNLTEVIESGCFCDKRGGFMDQFRSDFAIATPSSSPTPGHASSPITTFPPDPSASRRENLL
ncbi:MAG: hypothetical protein J7M08_06625 [Planctomycetes bacterium]|nr:hypothetical protein [Planctomycetota bacterium]